MCGFADITARDNRLVKLVRSLQSSARARRENGMFVLEGLRICMDAAENSIVFKKLVLSRSFVEKFPNETELFADRCQDVYRLPDSLFEYIADTDSPQGIIALAEIPVFDERPDCKGRYIALENVNDPSNLGAVARTAEALGASGMVVTTNGCDPFSPKALRASMGTLLRVKLYVTQDVCGFAKAAGLVTYACVPSREAEDISRIEFKDGSMLLIGNEANGLLEKTISSSEHRVTIPMSGRAESLNAAAAAAIAMWEMLKGVGNV